MLSENELYYKRLMKALGITMLSFLLFMNLCSLTLSFSSSWLGILPISPVAVDVMYQLIYAASYLLSFMLPVLIFKWQINRIGYLYAPIKTSLKPSPMIIPILIGGITLIIVQSNINAFVTDIFDIPVFSSGVIQNTSETAPLEGYQIVLNFIVICLVPAFCEEFLFRGAILTNCLPFGRSNAILISALLFSLMHQNFEQSLYTFAAGILLGVIYERFGSIWPCVLLHLINNFLPTAFSVAATSFNWKLSGVAYHAFNYAFYLLGLICIAILVIYESKQKKKLHDGVFGKSVPASDSFAAVSVAPRQAVKLFLNIPMLIFLIYSVLQIFILFGKTFLYGILQ